MGIAVQHFGYNPLAVRVRYLYTNGSGSTKTIYQGEPMCFIFDSTTNVLGYSKSSSAAGTTTAEGSQNEGKYLRVENPYSDNLLWFAGVVADGSWCGKQVANGSSLDLDLYIPNGAIVPVRAGVSCTVGRTVLSVLSATQYLGQPLSATQGRPVAVAEETVDRSGTNGLTLAKLDPTLFLYQDNTGDALMAAASGTSSMICNQINVTTAQTGGGFCAFKVKSTITAGAYANNLNSGGICMWLSGNIEGTPVGGVNCAHISLAITGGSIVEPTSALHVRLYESSGATITNASKLSCITLESNVAENASLWSEHCWIYLEQNGTYAPDCLFMANAIADIPMTTAASVTTSHKICFKVGTTFYYIPCGTSVS